MKKTKSEKKKSKKKEIKMQICTRTQALVNYMNKKESQNSSADVKQTAGKEEGFYASLHKREFKKLESKELEELSESSPQVLSTSHTANSE